METFSLVSFTQHEVFDVCPRCNMNQYFLICIAEQYSLVQIYHIVLIYFPADVELLPAITNNVIMNIHIQSLCGHTYSFFPQVICIRVKLLAHMMSFCLTIKKLRKIFFQRGYINLHSHQHYVQVFLSPHSGQHLALSVLLIIALLVGGQCYLIMLLIWVSQKSNDAEHPLCVY